MKSVGCVVYELDVNEIKALPLGWQVLRYDTLYRHYKLMQAGVDRVRQEGKRYVYFVFEAPSPKLKPEYNSAEVRA
ncbi:MAG: hypothetical protein K2L12_03955 [Clostridia bacterium]|nr:hypothetical protein [Clostridia bacterium]